MPLCISHSELALSGTWWALPIYDFKSLYFSKVGLNHSLLSVPSLCFSSPLVFCMLDPVFNGCHFLSSLYSFLHFLLVFSFHLLGVPSSLVFISENFPLTSWALSPHDWVFLILVRVVLSCLLPFPRCLLAWIEIEGCSYVDISGMPSLSVELFYFFLSFFLQLLNGIFSGHFFVALLFL